MITSSILRPSRMPNGKDDYPALFSEDIGKVLQALSYGEQDEAICKTIEAIKLRVGSLLPSAPLPAKIEVKSDPVSINKKCEELGLDVKFAVTHLRRSGYTLRELKSPEGEKAYLMSPTAWAYYSTHFTAMPETEKEGKA